MKTMDTTADTKLEFAVSATCLKLLGDGLPEPAVDRTISSHLLDASNFIPAGKELSPEIQDCNTQAECMNSDACIDRDLVYLSMSKQASNQAIKQSQFLAFFHKLPKSLSDPMGL